MELQNVLLLVLVVEASALIIAFTVNEVISIIKRIKRKDNVTLKLQVKK